MNNLVTSEGAAKTTMFTLLAGAVLNIVLDPVFIYVLDFGVAGAAAATAISQIVSSLVYLGYILRKKSIFSFRIRACCFSKEIMSEILKIGIPTMVFQLLTSLSISLINFQAKEYGDSVIAGMGPVTRIISVGSLMVICFMKGFQPCGIQLRGKKIWASPRGHTALHYLVHCFLRDLWGIGSLFSANIISQFTKGDLEMVRIGARALSAKRPVLPAVRFLHGVLLTVSGSWQRERGLYPGGLQTGHLLCAVHSAPSPLCRCQRNPVRTAGCRRHLCCDHCLHGNTSSQRTWILNLTPEKFCAIIN